MLFNAEGKALNKNLHQFKEYGSQRILTECSEKNLIRPRYRQTEAYNLHRCVPRAVK